jgi:hypothetical protein
MNREGLVFVNGLKQANEIETANPRELVERSAKELARSSWQGILMEARR